jgi:putative permease
MLSVLSKWYYQIFAEEESLILLIIIAVGLFLVVTMGDILAPFIASAICAFLLQGLVVTLQRWGLPRPLALAVTNLLFIGAFLIVSIFVVPLAWQQMVTLFSEFPNMVDDAREGLASLQASHSDMISEELLVEWDETITTEISRLGQWMLSVSVAHLPNMLGVLMYLVLVPLLVFFMLLDKDKIFAWFSSFLPRERPLMQVVWLEMNDQMANYARGKAIEILVVGSASYIAFAVLGLNYAALLGLLVGISVLIPYIGAAAVTIPVTLVAFFQWGWSTEFFYVFTVYSVIQFLDGNVLVPLLFSEAVNLHPIAIILAVLVFGGIWGLWGVFFAIPLATLIKSLLQAWPRGGSAPPYVEQEG